MSATDAPEDSTTTRIQAFWRIHERLPKQGPGSDASTRRALSIAGALPTQPRILDLGCGPGRQSLVLAQETGGRVTAIDLLAAFLEQLDERARAAGLADRITTRQASMADLDDPDESFDLIWSEGAIYNIGFSNGLRLWRRLLRPSGVIAVSEISWLVDDPPAHIRRYWETHYPGIRPRASNREQIALAGYQLLGDFVLPEIEWWEDYYTPIEARLDGMRSEREDPTWRAVVAEYDEELAIVREGLGSVGYVFYVMKKDEA